MKKLFLILTVVCLAYALPLAADTITLAGVSGASQGGFYTAPYFLSINGAPSIDAICVEYPDPISQPSR